MSIDEAKLNEFLGKAVGDLGAAMSATLVLVGDRLGLYKELAKGALTSTELARLDAALARSPKHAMVCLHHHPIAMGSRWLDTVGLTQPDEFWRVIDAHAHVRAVVWGHVHQVYDGHRGTVRLFATPSTGAQFLPKSERYAVDSRPPAFRQFDLHADGRIETVVHWIDRLPMQQAAAR